MYRIKNRWLWQALLAALLLAVAVQSFNTAHAQDGTGCNSKRKQHSTSPSVT